MAEDSCFGVSTYEVLCRRVLPGTPGDVDRRADSVSLVGSTSDSPTASGMGTVRPGPTCVVGAGWLGTAISAAAGVATLPRRVFHGDQIERHATVFVASGRSSVGRDECFPEVLRDELSHLRRVLDACARAEIARVVVLGSSDVTGLARYVSGHTPQAPLTPYARVKAALEDECCLHAGQGLAVTSVRLAPVHGPGKARTAQMVRLARAPVIPLPGGGRQSIGFLLLQDAVAALRHLGSQTGPAIVSVGGGPTALHDLLGALATAQGRNPRWLPIPVPGAAVRAISRATLPEKLHWLLRLSLPRVIAMEVDVPVTPIPDAAAALVASC